MSTLPPLRETTRPNDAPSADERELYGFDLSPGSGEHWRSFVGPPDAFDVQAVMQFTIATQMGLREWNYVCEIGCGSLRAGRLLMTWLLPGRYCGIEPERWLLEQGIEREVSQGLVDLKRPRFDHNTDFDLSVFDEAFDLVIAQSIFSHASRAQVEQCLASVRSSIHHGSIFLCTFVLGEHDYTGSEWVYPGCVTFREQTVHQIAAEAGFAATRIDYDGHPTGQIWFGLTPTSA